MDSLLFQSREQAGGWAGGTAGGLADRQAVSQPTIFRDTNYSNSYEINQFWI